VELARVTVQPARESATLARMVTARRVEDIEDAKASTQLAVTYQLLTRHTCCVVVHERDLASKVSGEADLHVVPQMLAAGWGGTGSVAAGGASGPLVAGLAAIPLLGGATGLGGPLFSRGATSYPTTWRSPRTRPGINVPLPDELLPRLDAATLRSVAQRTLQALAAEESTQRVLEAVLQPGVPATLEAAVVSLQELGLTPFDSWLVLVLWVMDRSEGAGLRWEGQPLRALLSDHTRARLPDAFAALERRLQAGMALARPSGQEPLGLLQRLLGKLGV
jgi:hypothetical protein